MASLLSELQFCQLENDALRERLKTIKMDVNSMKKEIQLYFKEIECTFSGRLEDGSIRLTKEDQYKLFQIIDQVLKTT